MTFLIADQSSRLIKRTIGQPRLRAIGSMILLSKSGRRWQLTYGVPFDRMEEAELPKLSWQVGPNGAMRCLDASWVAG
jgi:hypothetical protein